LTLALTVAGTRDHCVSSSWGFDGVGISPVPGLRLSAPGLRLSAASMDTCLVDEKLRCRRCREVIGVYEQVVVQVKGGWRETSLLNERPGRSRFGDCYHRTCFHEAHGSGGDDG